MKIMSRQDKKTGESALRAAPLEPRITGSTIRREHPPARPRCRALPRLVEAK